MPPADGNPGHRGGGPLFQRMALFQRSIRSVQQRCQPCLGLAAHRAQAECAANHAEQAAIAGDLLQVVAQAPAPHAGDLLLQSLQRQGVLAVDQQVMHQQLFEERVQLGRQLGEEYAEVGHDPVPRQWRAGTFGADTAAIDHMQFAAMAQQVVQVQVFLGETGQVQPADHRQSLAQHGLLAIGQGRVALHPAPGLPEAFGGLQVLEQQPAALPRQRSFSQQRRGVQPLPVERADTGQLALEVAFGLAAHQQLGQHLAPLPQCHADVALPRQHPQQAVQFQATGDVQPDGQLRGAPRVGQFGQGH
ncbi:hypothetical protein D3C84_439730 [compost metagenome]